MLIGNFLDKSTFKHLIEHCVLPGSVEGDEIQPVATMDVPSNLPEECYSYWQLGFMYTHQEVGVPQIAHCLCKCQHKSILHCTKIIITTSVDQIYQLQSLSSTTVPSIHFIFFLTSGCVSLRFLDISALRASKYRKPRMRLSIHHAGRPPTI